MLIEVTRKVYEMVVMRSLQERVTMSREQDKVYLLDRPFVSSSYVV